MESSAFRNMWAGNYSINMHTSPEHGGLRYIFLHTNNEKAPPSLQSCTQHLGGLQLRELVHLGSFAHFIALVASKKAGTKRSCVKATTVILCTKSSFGNFHKIQVFS